LGSFFKRSLGKLLTGKGEEAAPAVHLAAFGKHPGWDDHIEDLGLETGRLIDVKRTLYTHGIAGNINSGAWEKLADNERLEGFRHLFVWHTPRSVVVGRMWSSRDGKGRTRYPMVVCAECAALPLQWIAAEVLPRLEDVEARCVQTTDASDVRSILSDAARTLRLSAQGGAPVPEALTPSPRALAVLADRPEMGPDHQGLHRVLYEIERQMSAFHAGSADRTRTGTSMLRAQQMRVPACAGTPVAAARLWLSFLLGRLDKATPILLVLPFGEPWLDVIAGGAGAQELYCVRASPEAVPLVTDIPYNLDADFVARVEEEIGASRNAPPGSEELEAEAPTPSPPAAPGSGPTQSAPLAPEPKVVEAAKPEIAPPPEPAPAPGPRAQAPPEAPAPRAPQPSVPGPRAAAPAARAKPRVAAPARPSRPPVAQARPAPASSSRIARPRPRGLGRRLLKLALLLLVIVAIVAAAFLLLPMLREPSPAPPELPAPEDAQGWRPAEAEAWQALCTAYSEWFKPFFNDVTRQQLDEWRKDADLAELVVQRIEAARKVATDPRDIAGEAGAYEDMALNPPKAAKSREGVARTRQALEVVRNIKVGIAEWPSRGSVRMDALAQEYEQLGWRQPAEQFGSLVRKLKEGPVPDAASVVDEALKARRLLAAIEAHRKGIADLREAVRALGDQLAGQVDQLVLAAAGPAETLEALRGKLGAVERDIAAMASGYKEIESRRRAIGELGDDALAQRFLECVKAAVPEAKEIRAASSSIGAARPLAEAIEARLAELNAHRKSLAQAGDAPLADKLWQLARGDALTATTLTALRDKLGHAQQLAAKIAAHRREIQQQRDAMKELGDDLLAKHAQHIQAAVADARDLEALAASLADAATLTAKIAASWSEVEGLQKTLARSGDPILASFGEYVLAKARSAADLAGLPDTLGKARGLAKDLVAFVEKDWQADRIDRALFARESEVRRTFQGKATTEILEKWQREAADYARLDPKKDPRSPVDQWHVALKDTGWRITFLKDAADPKKRESGHDCEQRHQALAKEVHHLLALAWVKKNEATIAKAADTLGKRLTSLQGELKDVVEPPERWLGNVRGQAEVASSKVVNQEWLRRRDALVSPALTPQKLKSDPDTYKSLWHDVRALRDFLRGLDGQDELPGGLPEAAKGVVTAATREAFAQQIAAKREQTLQAIIGGIPWRDGRVPALALDAFKQKSEWKAPCGAYARWREDGAKLLVAFGAIEKLLDAGCLLDGRAKEAPQTVRQLYGEWKAENVYQELGKLVEPVAKRVDQLLRIEALGREPLVGRARGLGTGDAPEITLAVWKRLGQTKDWPASIDELKLEATLRGVVGTLLGKFEAQAEPLKQELAREGLRRWEKGFHSLVRRAQGDDLNDSDIRAAIGLLSKFGAEFNGLSPQSQFHAKLYDLRQMAADLLADEPKPKIDAKVLAFEAALGKFPADVAGHASELLGDLKAFVERKEPTDPTAGLEKAGPGGARSAGAWLAEIADEGKSVVYSLKGTGHKLAFAHVEPSDKASKPCYLCTTEVSVGLFIDVTRAGNRWAELGGLLEAHGRVKPKGPMAWEWGPGRQGIQEIRLSQHWLARESLAGKHYPDGLAPGAPSAEHPMQRVSPAAALCFAWLMGCRLPTVAEWQAACGAHEKSGADGKRNLRDRTWRKQQDHVRERAREGIVPEWPDGGVFLPESFTGKMGGEATVVADRDDGALWFSPVGSGKEFQHLVGNVAEFVLDRPARFEEALATLDGAQAEAVAGRFTQFVRENADSLYVIGGSALSAPELWNGRDRPFDRALPVAVKKHGLDSYWDVGFRLAFTAPKETPADQLRRLLRKRGYLTGPPGASDGR